jgi:hypothetical protein
MLSLQKGEKEKTKYFLDLCEKFFNMDDFNSYILTKNNYCCYYSEIGQLRSARNLLIETSKLKILNKIEEMSSKKSDDFNYLNEIANDFTNLSAIENKIGSNYESLLHGMQALALNGLSLVNLKLNAPKEEIRTELLDTLSLSYYNLGVQQEFLKRKVDSEVSFAKSEQFSNIKTKKIVKEKIKKYNKIELNTSNLVNQIK